MAPKEPPLNAGSQDSSRYKTSSKPSVGREDHARKQVHGSLPSPGWKERVTTDYEKAVDYYQILWGEHMHYGFFKSDSDTKEQAQRQLIDLLLERSKLSKGSTVLDVGCGLGGTTRYLAKHWDCEVTGVTISRREIEIAKQLAAAEGRWLLPKTGNDTDYFEIGGGGGEVRFVELDAEQIADYFGFSAEPPAFNCFWVVEALSYLQDKELFFRNAEMVLMSGGKLVIADWFKVDGLTEEPAEADPRNMEDGLMRLRLCTTTTCINLARQFNFQTISEPLDISDRVSKSWEIDWSLIQGPALKSPLKAQGTGGIPFPQAFHALRQGYENGNFKYITMVFQK